MNIKKNTKFGDGSHKEYLYIAIGGRQYLYEMLHAVRSVIFKKTLIFSNKRFFKQNQVNVQCRKKLLRENKYRSAHTLLQWYS